MKLVFLFIFWGLYLYRRRVCISWMEYPWYRGHLIIINPYNLYKHNFPSWLTRLHLSMFGNFIHKDLLTSPFSNEFLMLVVWSWWYITLHSIDCLLIFFGIWYSTWMCISGWVSWVCQSVQSIILCEKYNIV